MNEKITGTLSNKVTGIGNEIKNTTERGNDNLNFDLGSTDKPGYYRIDFYFSQNDVETYYVPVLPKGFNESDFPEIEQTILINKKYKELIIAINNYIKHNNSFRPILNNALNNYLKQHVIEATFGLVICIAAPFSGTSLVLSPVLTLYCRNSVKDAAIDYFFEFMLALNEELYAKKLLNYEYYKFFKENIKTTSFLVSFYQANNTYEKILAISEFSEKDEKQQLSMGLNYTNQLYKKYQFVFELLEE